ncbi:DUF3899 domain-containing protein [Bacillus sp. PS06]|nr:DUF3899 domain-containing protein [Bacillus sp. PS06]
MYKLLLWLISLLFSYIGFIFFDKSLLNWADFLFLIGLSLLMIGSVMTIISGGFFTSFLHSCKVFFHSISRKEQVIQESERKDPKNRSHFRTYFTSSKMILLFGFGYCAVSLLLSIILIN